MRVETKVIPATDHRGTRIRATLQDAGGRRFEERAGNRSITSWDYAENYVGNCSAAARAMLRAHGIKGTFIGIHMAGHMVFVDETNGWNSFTI